MMKRNYFYLIILIILLNIFFFKLDMEIYAAIYRVVDPQGVTMRVSSEPILYEEEIEQGCQIYLLELGKRLEDFDLDKKIRGIVFWDLNENGKREKGEQGIVNIQVSNGLDITPTDSQGHFELNKEGTFIFITMPGDFRMTTSWYRIISDQNMNFGLKEEREKNKEHFTFVHLTDPHTDLVEGHNRVIETAVYEIIDFNPDFVIDTGDMVYEGDKESIEQTRRWFNRYVSLIDGLNMPVFHTIGNHDIAGIYYKKDLSVQSGYNKWLYYSYFGPEYYSFDWGNFHCIVLDPNQFGEGSQYFEISEEQISWLKKDLSFYDDSIPLLVFFHEPINTWKNKDDILILLRNRKIRLFSGHWHFDVLLAHQEVLEQVTGALCGEWWKGNCTDGRMGGYRIVKINGEQIHSFYREIGQDRQIEFLEPKPMTTEPLNIIANIYTEYPPLISAECQINQGKFISMNIDDKDDWFVVQGTMNPTFPLASGYHRIEIKGKDQVGEFSKTVHFKIGSEKKLSFKELYSHFSTFQWHLIQVEGKLKKQFTETLYSSHSRDFVNGAIILKDQSDYGGILLGEYGISKEEELERGQFITAEIIPLRFRWDSIERKQKLMILLNLFRLPEGFLKIENFLKPEAVQILWLIRHQIHPEK